MIAKNNGTLLAIFAYALWGVLPFYWKTLQAVSAYELTMHRVVWSFLLLMAIITYKKAWQEFFAHFRDKKAGITVVATALLLAGNWLIYIWAVNAGYLVEASLGYFINPLINVLLGVIFLRERLRRWQWVAIGIAASGVLFLTLMYGVFPWIALSLALSFGFYGLLRKVASVNAVQGMSMEMSILILPALIYFSYLQVSGSLSFGSAGTKLTIFILLAGLVTVIPLLLFTSAAKKITLTALGIIQYITPSCQFILGVLVYHESFTLERFMGFVIIWSALIIYTIERILYFRTVKRLQQI
jgi:chloramphenicol-sensitive protein RarD